MKYVLHVNDQPVADFIDITLYVVPPNKPFRFDNDFHAELFVRHMSHSGVVFVTEQYDDDNGQFKLDLGQARTQAAAQLEEAEKAVIQAYVTSQMEDRLAHGKPARPPMGRQLEVVKKRGVDLGEEYGIYPIGWGKSKVQADREKEMEELRESNRKVTQQLADLLQQLPQLRVVTGDGDTTAPDITIPVNKRK